MGVPAHTKSVSPVHNAGAYPYHAYGGNVEVMAKTNNGNCPKLKHWNNLIFTAYRLVSVLGYSVKHDSNITAKDRSGFFWAADGVLT